MSRLIKGAPFAFSILIGTKGTLAFYIDIHYILMKISFKFIENFADGGCPIVPSQNPGSHIEEDQLIKGQKGVILGTLNPE